MLSLLRERMGPAVQARVPLAPYTTFQIGGPAEWFIDVQSADELAHAIQTARDLKMPWFLLGLGANILVGDGGFPGLVIRNSARKITLDASRMRLHAESGAIIYPAVIDAAVSAGWTGLEHYVGIPSTVGGALWQNLHFLSPDRSRTMFIEEVVLEAEILTPEGERAVKSRDWFQFGYDYSILHDEPHVVLSATFQLEHGDRSRMHHVMEENLQWRRERHPPLDKEPSAGSIFKKIDGIGAGRLIDQCGLKGFRIGGAMITKRHANIMINAGGATAADVRALILHVQDTVERETGYRLETEIGMIGRF